MSRKISIKQARELALEVLDRNEKTRINLQRVRRNKWKKQQFLNLLIN